MSRLSLQILREQGFDKACYMKGLKAYSVRCSQCEALVLNGIPCHEIGCPNAARSRKTIGPYE